MKVFHIQIANNVAERKAILRRERTHNNIIGGLFSFCIYYKDFFSCFIFAITFNELPSQTRMCSVSQAKGMWYAAVCGLILCCPYSVWRIQRVKHFTYTAIVAESKFSTAQSNENQFSIMLFFLLKFFCTQWKMFKQSKENHYVLTFSSGNEWSHTYSFPLFADSELQRKVALLFVSSNKINRLQTYEKKTDATQPNTLYWILLENATIVMMNLTTAVTITRDICIMTCIMASASLHPIPISIFFPITVDYKTRRIIQIAFLFFLEKSDK